MDDLLDTLADSQRLAILESLLASNRPTSQSELREALDVSDSTKGTLSKNMGRLERAGLIGRHEDGYTLRHRLLTSNILQATANLARVLAEEEADNATQRVRRLRRGSSPPAAPARLPRVQDTENEQPSEVGTLLQSERAANEA